MNRLRHHRVELALLPAAKELLSPPAALLLRRAPHPTRCFAVTSRRRRLRHHRVGLALLPAAKELLSPPAAALRLALLVACLVSRDPRFKSLPAREHITTRRPFDGQHLPLPSLCCRGHTQYPAATRAKTSCVHSCGDGSVSSCASEMCDYRARPICTPTYHVPVL